MSENASLLNLYQDFNNPAAAQMMPFMAANPQMNYQAMMMFKAQAMKLMQFRAMYMQNMMKAQEINKMDPMKFNTVSKIEPQVKVERPPVNPVKLERPVKVQYQDPPESKVIPILSPGPSNMVTPSNVVSPPSEFSQQLSSFAVKGPFSCEQINFDNYLKAELEKILRFLLSNMGKNQKEIDEGRNLYSSNPTLLQVYDKLVMKYFSAKKCKEDIVRYILRKALKMMRASMMKKEKVNGRKAALLLCKRYFYSRFEELEKSGVNVENEDELLEFCMPYKKNSKNKTMNTSFVVEIFASEEFCQEYRLFLDNLEGYLEEDNNKKMKKLIVFIMDCIKNNSLPKLGNFNRLPWLDIWNTDTKNIAVSLMPEQKLPPVKKLHE